MPTPPLRDPADLVAAAVARDPAAPLLTFYDDATGERVELSATTTANWVAKTANLLQDEIGAEPGERVALLLPLHWQTVVLLLASWSTGLEVLPSAGPVDGADLVVCGPDALADAAAGAADGRVLGVSLQPMGRPLPSPSPGVVDYAAEVLAQGDHFAPWAALDPGRKALELDDRRLTATDIVGIDLLGLSAADRVLTTADPTSWAGLHDGVLAPLVAGASLVLCRHLDPARLGRLTAEERVTRVVGPTPT